MAIQVKTQDNSSDQNHKTRVQLILDESGSMGSVREQTIDGINEYINGLLQDHEQNGTEYMVSIVKFEGGNIVDLIQNTPVQDVEIFTEKDYTPCGMTNLNDAVGITIQKMRNDADLYRNLVVVMTDGIENASYEYTKASVKALIDEVENQGWNVIFLGADIDVQGEASSIGIKTSKMRSYDKSDISRTMRSMATSTVAYASVTGSVAGYDDFFENEDWDTSA